MFDCELRSGSLKASTCVVPAAMAVATLALQTDVKSLAADQSIGTKLSAVDRPLEAEYQL